MTIDFARLGRLIRKELSETLRDRRTIITLVLMPVLLYPLLSVAFQQLFLASRLAPGQIVEYSLGFVSEDDVGAFYERLRNGDRILERRTTTKEAKEKLPTEPKYIVNEYDALELELRAGRLDVIVRNARPRAFVTLPPPPPPGFNFVPVVEFEMLYLPTSAAAQGALAYIEQRLAAANENDLRGVMVDVKKRLAAAKEREPGLTLQQLAQRLPGAVVRITRAPLEEAGGGAMISLASLVPLILILMTITGAVYPAIDLTAGERERGTLEILVAAPVPRLGLLFAKYVSVLTVAVLTALVNLVAMTVTLLLSGLGPVLFPNQGLSPTTIVLVFGLLLLFAAFFSAVLLCITSFARSFKEAQAYLIPLMLVSMAPGVMGMMPGLKLAEWAWAPLLNIVLLGRDLFEGGAELGPAFVVIAATLAYALAAISLAARIFGAEGVLYSEQSTWADLLRRPAASQPYANVSAALWCLALMIPLSFVLKNGAGLLSQAQRLDESALIYFGPPIALAMFGLLPALFAWRSRLQMSSAFAMTLPPWPAWIAGLVLGVSVWPVLFAGLSLMNVQAGETYRELYERIAESYRQLGVTTKVALVVIPAALEEWFFRGYLYGAIRQKAGAAATIALTGFLFGLMHFVLNMQLGLVRVLPSAVMGVLLGVIRESSGSVWPGMLLHVIHNACLVLLIQDGSDQPASIEPWWIGAGAAGCAVGAGLTWLGRVRPPTSRTMMGLGVAIAFLLCSAWAGHADDGKVEDAFNSLFSGKDLTGWTIENKGKFSVKNGVIFLDRGAGWLRSDKTYQDFELRLDFRFVSKGADSGIFLRAVNEGSNWPAKNYQVQTMDNESIGAVYATGLARVKMKRDADLVRKARKTAGEWQSYAITVKGDHAEIRLNGILVITADGMTVQAGHIGLQGEGGQLEFKNLRIKESK